MDVDERLGAGEAAEEGPACMSMRELPDGLPAEPGKPEIEYLAVISDLNCQTSETFSDLRRMLFCWQGG